MDDHRLHGEAARDLATEVGSMVERQPDKVAAAYTAARASLLALMYLTSPQQAALVAYRLADEMADAAGKASCGAG